MPGARNGRLYGLGAADCKGGLAAQIFAGALLERSMLPLRGNLVVLGWLVATGRFTRMIAPLVRFTPNL